MKLPINLASQPYENVRPLYAGLAIASALLVILSVALAWSIRSSRNETRLLTDQSTRLDRETAKLSSDQSELTRWLARPEVQDIRSQSDYLNSMIVRKSLSWTQIFMDLEKVLPNQVLVTTIHPGLSADKQPELNLSVSALTLPPLVQFLKNLESSTRFDKPVVGSQRFPGERAQDPSISLDLQVAYRPDGEEQPDIVNVADEPPAITPVKETIVPAPVKSSALPPIKPLPTEKKAEPSQPKPVPETQPSDPAALSPARRLRMAPEILGNVTQPAAKEAR
jgi:type IV pilus assembly protein PilN